MADKDLSWRPWAKLSELKDGDVIELDEGFTCHSAGKTTIHRDKQGLYFECAEGKHYLSGQGDDGEHCVGIYNL